jgi:peptide/nickel transport system substrate-binding protein
MIRTTFTQRLRSAAPGVIAGILLVISGLTWAQRELTVAVTSDPQSMDPYVSATSGTVTAVNHIFDSLVQRHPETMAIVPALATSWSVSEDRIYEFTLREGVRFQSGDPFTAHDVVFSFERMRQPGFEAMGNYVNPLIESVEALDSATVRITLLAPYAPFLNRLPTFYMVPEAYVRAVGDDRFAEEPIGTGPYRFVDWVHGEYWTFEAYEGHWAGAPEVQRVTFRPIPEASTRIAALLSGAVDIIEQVNLTDIPRLERDPNIRVEAVNDNRIYFYAFQHGRPPFDDVRVRQAIAHAIDWDEILGIFEGYAFRVRLPALPTDFGYPDYIGDLETLLPSYDPERARQLLAEAGYPDGLSIVIEAPSGNYPRDAELAQAVANELGRVGIDAEVRISEWAVYLSEVWRGGNVENLGFFSMGNPLFDPDHLYTVHFDPNGGGQYFNSSELTALGERGRVVTDPDERTEIYRQMMEYLVVNQPYLWTHGVQQVYAMRSDIEWRPRADNRIFIEEVSFRD